MNDHDIDKHAQLSAIVGLTLADCLNFFDEKENPRSQAIFDLCDVEDEEFEVETIHTSEGDDNGAYMLGWRWVPFYGTALDKEKEETDEEDADADV
jgi:hypothetical protein